MASPSVSIPTFLSVCSLSSLMASLRPFLFFFLLAYPCLCSQEQNYQVAVSVCKGTMHVEDACASTLSSFPNLASMTTTQIIEHVIYEIANGVVTSSANVSNILSRLLAPNSRDGKALADCGELFKLTLAHLNVSLRDLFAGSGCVANSRLPEVGSFLSAAMTNQYTCLDGFAYSRTNIRSLIKDGLYGIAKLVSISLALVKKFKEYDDDKCLRNKVMREDEPFPDFGKMRDGFPEWLSGHDRKLLTTTINGINADLVVAQDGSGNYRTISEAVAAAPSRSSTRFVIYIKAGGYFENVVVDSTKTNIMFVGDGMWKTVVKASRSVGGGSTTYDSATVAVVGAGFLARDIGFENTAGPSNHQAVALRSGSDLSAFYRCSFVAYQDTLYVHSLRQFYRECDVYGTVDFIFGNAATVIQRCNLYARLPLSGQQNLFTAQGRTDPNQNTGISIQGSKIAAAADLLPQQNSVKSYLGRPWKEYSRTVVMQSQIDGLIDPAGWLEWDGDFALSTLYYGEYKNSGAGSSTSGRVTWPGYHVITDPNVASQFTANNFIQADEWIPATGFPYDSGLL